MANLPSASVTLATSGGGVGAGSDLICILSPTASGTVGISEYTRVASLLADKGRGMGVDLAAHYVQLTKKPFLFGKLPSATAGATQIDNETVTGTSVVTVTGAPYDDAVIKFRVVAGGTIGTVGITFDYSLDGGRTYSGVIRLGTATSYLIPDTNVTLAFAAGTLVAGDVVTVYCFAPMWNNAGLTAAFTAIAAQAKLPRLIIVCGDVTSADEIQDCIDEINAYETTYGRHSRVLCNFRDKYAPAKMQGNPTDLDFVAAADTITRNTGSWIADGFKVGMDVTIAGTANNNAVASTVVTVTTTVLTLAAGVVDEANLSGVGVTITGTESASSWKSALAVAVGNTPLTAKTAHRCALRAGRARRKSPLDGSRKRRPAAWWDACQIMAHDLHVSSGKVENGALSGVTITNADGSLEDHDERVDGGLLSLRVGCLTSYDVDSAPGVYVALPLTLDEDNAPLSRLPVGFVADLACKIAKAETTRKLNANVALNADGTIRESEAKRIEGYLNSVLRNELLAERAEGARASDVSFSMARDVDLRVVGAEVPCEVDIIPLGYLEKITTTVRVSRIGG